MATARVISWILGNGIYAYIYMPDGQPQIGNKILENSPLWVDIVREVERWGNDEEKYKKAYENLSNIVSSKGYTLPPYDNRFFDGGINLEGYKLALLSGVGGIGGGSGSGVGPSDGADEGIDSSEYEKFIEEMERELNKAREDLEKKAEEISQFINGAFNETYHNAKQEIEEARKQLAQMREDLEEKLKAAKDALDKAKEALGDGKIDPDEMEEIFRSVKEYSEWMNTYSGVITSLKSEYDEVNGQLGSIGEAEDASAGLFAKFATCINVLSGTVGNVHTWMVASSATIGQIASWYDDVANEATEAIRFMSASAAQIVDTINYVYGEGEDAITAKLERKMDAKDATIKDTIMRETSGSIINLSRKIDAINGEIRDSISYLASNGDLVSMGEEMDAMNFEMKQWMTKVDDLNKTAIDMREEWSEASGKLSTVSNLIALTDADGNVLYFASGGTYGEDNYFVDLPVFEDEDGMWRDASKHYQFTKNQIYAKFSNAVGSWFQQQSDRIEMGIRDELKDLTAGITMGFTEDESFINLVASKVVIDADMIAKAISAKTANIGGIMIGSGVVQSMFTKGGYPAFKLNSWNGQVYAQDLLVNGDAGLYGNISISGNAKVRGSITATSLTLTGKRPGEDEESDIPFDEYLEDKVGEEKIVDLVNEFLKDYKPEFDTDGFITLDDLENWYSQQDGLTEEQFNALKEQLAGAEIQFTITEEEDENGVVVHRANLGGKEYVWKTMDCDGYLVLNKDYGSGQPNFVISKDGLLQANNIVVYGAIHANAGYIGGFEIGENRLIAYSSNGDGEGNPKEVAFLNGSEEYEDDEKGKLIFAAGITDNITFYKYELVSGSSSSPQYIYTMNPYGNANKTKNGEVLEVYLSNDNKNVYESDISFYYRKVFLRKKFTLNPDTGGTGGIVGGGDDSGGNSGSGDNGNGSSGGSNIGIQQPWIPGMDMVGDQYIRQENQDFVFQTSAEVFGLEIDGWDDRGELGDLIITDYSDYELFCEDLPVKQDIGGGVLAIANYFQEFITNSNGDIYKIPKSISTQEFSEISVRTNTRIYEDGSIFTKSLVTEDGYFKGEINANGVFRGELNNATGTLSGVKMTDTTFSGDIILENTNCFTAKSGSTDNYLEISTNSLPKEGGKSKYYVTPVSWSQQNKNGANEGKYYESSKQLVSCSFRSGATITIPTINGELWRYTPSLRECKKSTVTLTITFNGGGINSSAITKTFGGFEGSGSQTDSFTFTGGTYTAKSNGRLTIYLTYNIHLSDKSWLGLDKASGSLSVAAKSNVEIELPKPETGMYVSPEGFAIYTKGAQLICDNDGIRIMNKTGSYGLKITSGSIKKIKGSTESDL